MQLNEIFTQPTRWEWTVNDGVEDMEAEFTIGDKGYLVNFIGSTDNDQNIIVHLMFSMFTNPNQSNDSSGWGDASDGITNTGNAIMVFATVKAIMEKFVSMYNPYAITFSAKEPSRKKLYKRFVSEFVKGGWRAEANGDSWILYNNKHVG